MSWEKELEELRQREELAKKMGGEERVNRQHDQGRLTVSERIEILLDDASFHEVGALAGKATYDDAGEIFDFTPSNFVMGPVAGLGAVRVATSHFSVMIKRSSQLFIAGPPVVERGIGHRIEKEELGGSDIHTHTSGAVDNEVDSEAEALS